MLLTAWGRWMKPLWIAILVAAGVAQHFMLTYGVVMDTAMLANTMQTNPREAGDLLGWAFVANLLLVVALPTALDRPRAGARARRGGRSSGGTPCCSRARSPSRWRRALRCSAGSRRWCATTCTCATSSIRSPASRSAAVGRPCAALSQEQGAGADHRRRGARARATRPAAKPPLVVARRRRDGARRPLLAQRLCARHQSRAGEGRRAELPRASARAAPTRATRCRACSRRSTRPAFEKRSGERENLLDLLQAAGLAVLWLDNQSGCKDVCARVPSATTTDLPPADRRAALQRRRMPRRRAPRSASTSGSPACRRSAARRASSSSCTRWAATGRRTTSARRRRRSASCRSARTSALAQCDHDQLVNAYDNIDRRDRPRPRRDDRMAEAPLRRPRDRARSTSATTASRLGELGIFLHGLPYAFAPEAQKHVPLHRLARRRRSRSGAASTSAASAPLARRAAQPRQPLPHACSACST